MPTVHPSRSIQACLLAGVLAAAILVVVGTAEPTAKAATPSGWNIVTAATTGPQQSNLLFGTTCTSSWNCWAVGVADENFGNNFPPYALIEHWDGSSWTVSSAVNPPGMALSALWGVTCVTTSDCWAVGTQQVNKTPAPVTLAEHWNGVSWSVVATPPTNGYLFSVTCTSASDCWAAGTSVTDNGNTDPLHGIMDQWNGTSWTAVPTQPSGQPADQFNSVACVSASDCWAVGFAGPNPLNNNFLPNIMPETIGANAFIEHWNGTSWTVTPAPTVAGPQGTYLDGVTCVSANSCWAVGANMDSIGDPSSTLVVSWNGTTWSTVPSPPSASGSLLTDVTCLDASQCWASGMLLQGGGGGNNASPNSMIASWNGSAWSVDPSPSVAAFGYLSSVGCASSGCFSAGFAVINGNNNSVDIQGLVEQLVLPPAQSQGFDAVGSDGGVFSFGNMPFLGSMGGTHLNAPMVGMAATPDGGGYWLVAADGGVFTFGDATFDGSLGGTHLNAPIVGMASSPDGGGYWLVASDGGVFGLGDATFNGSLGGIHLNAPIVGLAATPDGGGYWLVAADGGVFTFGDAGYDGSVPGQGITHPAPITGIAATPDGGGYWVVGSDGAVYAYGDAVFMGSLVGFGLAAPITGVSARA